MNLTPPMLANNLQTGPRGPPGLTQELASAPSLLGAVRTHRVGVPRHRGSGIQGVRLHLGL